MALASANRVAVRYIAESVFGTTPTTGNPHNLRLTGESLSYGIQSETSKEIRADRQVTDVVLVGASANGSINVELSYGEYDTLFEALLMGTWSTNVLTNGTTERYFTIEKEFQDVGQFFAFRGMEVSKGSFSFQSGAIVTGSFDFIGKDSVTGTTTTLPGTPIASQTKDVMNAVTGVGAILENGAPLTSTFIKSLKFDIDNKLRGQTAIGTFGNVAIGSGTLECKGELEVYLKDGTMYDKFVNNTATSISWESSDPAGNKYKFEFLKVKFNDAKVQAGGLDQDVMLTMPFTCLMDSVTGKTLRITRTPAV
jgi:hypothetical protein